MWAQNIKELPKMVKSIGDLLNNPRGKLLNRQDIANQVLAFEFGWKPLLSDLATLLDVSTHVTRRVEELKKLQSNNGLKRRLKMGKQQFQEEYNTPIDFGEGYATVTRTTVNERWGTVRWLPTELPAVPPTSEELIRKAKQQVLGLTPEALVSGAWDLLPWSWLIDWFIPVGDYISTWSNSVPARPVNACIMRRADTFNSIKVTHEPWIDPGENTGRWTNLYRSVTPASFGGRLPFLNANRLSVLGSLFVQRFMR
jgi:hypothetical protein